MTKPDPLFDYNTAFSRNIGWLTAYEQQRIRGAKIAVAGAGGVGGIHLQTLARLGFARFHVADLDTFELANFNRQAGARLDTLGLPKAEVAKELVTSINPEADISVFPNGVTEDNLEDFLDGVDVYIDGLDFFVLDLRAKLFKLAREKGITAITAAPIGMGAGYLIFTPDSMSFDRFFALGDNADTFEGAAGFLLGLTPAMLQRPYLADPSQVDLVGQRGPSTAIACQLCAGVAAAEAVKVVLRRGPIKPAPYYHHFDAYRGRFVTRKLLGGAKNPLHRLKRGFVTGLTKRFSKSARPPDVDAAPSDTIVERILEAARWAPSADNTQPWTFEVQSDSAFSIHVSWDEEHIYEYRRGEPTRFACGMLLENLKMRAARYGYRLDWSLDEISAGQASVHCTLAQDDAPELSALETMIEARSTNRGLLSLKALDGDVRLRLERAVGPDYQVHWHTGLSHRWTHALLNARAAAVRLRTPETIPVHQQIVRFDTPFPRWGLPSRGLGLSALAHTIMRFAFRSKKRSEWLLGRLGGAFYAALEMDVLPGLACGAHFSLEKRGETREADRGGDLTQDLLHGAAIQRFWLACTAEGLAFQPACAPLCFYHYGQAGISFSERKGLQRAAKRFSKRFSRIYGENAEAILFRGRVGFAPRKGGEPRSLRQPLADLVHQTPQSSTDEETQSAPILAKTA
ncbi:MAG: ThiF family adenylyltransferase [Pseudomonadota bacterium]